MPFPNVVQDFRYFLIFVVNAKLLHNILETKFNQSHSFANGIGKRSLPSFGQPNDSNSWNYLHIVWHCRVGVEELGISHDSLSFFLVAQVVNAVVVDQGVTKSRLEETERIQLPESTLQGDVVIEKIFRSMPFNGQHIVLLPLGKSIF